MKRWLALGALFLLVVGASFGVLERQAAADATQGMVAQVERGMLAAVQARMLGWAALGLIAVNFLALGFVMWRLAGRGWASLEDTQWPLRAIHKRQLRLGKSVAELNAYFQDLEADRQQLSTLINSINEQMTAVEREIEAAAARKSGASRATPG